MVMVFSYMNDNFDYPKYKYSKIWSEPQMFMSPGLGDSPGPSLVADDSVFGVHGKLKESLFHH